MSLSLATTWVKKTVRLPAACAEALGLLDQAAAKGLTATMIIGPRISTSGKCFLGRWDGRELVVLELTRAQQADWSVNPAGLFKQMDPRGLPSCEFSIDPLASLTVTRIENSESHDGWAPLSGTCSIEMDSRQLIQNWALRAEYFHPELHRPVTSMWYQDMFLHAAQLNLDFHFSPLFSSNNPQPCRGLIAVFLQLFTADDWSLNIGCRCISNVAEAFVTLR